MQVCALRVHIALILFLSFGFVASQTIVSAALQDLTRYYGAAVRLIANAISGVNNVEAAAIPRPDRDEVRNELRRISVEISSLRAAQMPLVTDLSEYVKKSRTGALDGKSRENEWSRILSSIDRVSQIVRTTFEVVETSRWLKVALDVSDRLALREVLIGRAALLQRLRSLPAPGSADEVDQVDQMNRYYIQLVKSLGDLNVSLTRATEKLRSE